MANLLNALRELQAERTRAQAKVEKLDQAISAIASVNGSLGVRRAGSQRVVSAEARRKMSLAQKARWAKRRKPAASVSAPTGRKGLSIAARQRIAAAQRRRWARVRAQQAKAA